MANIHTVLDAIIENGTSGKRVQIEVSDRNEYETIRTRLVTLWSQHKEILEAVSEVADPLAVCSLCGDYSSTDSLATFYLGKPRRRMAKSYSFVITDSTDAPTIAPTLAVNEPANDELPIPTPRAAE